MPKGDQCAWEGCTKLADVGARVAVVLVDEREVQDEIPLCYQHAADFGELAGDIRSGFVTAYLEDIGKLLEEP